MTDQPQDPNVQPADPTAVAEAAPSPATQSPDAQSPATQSSGVQSSAGEASQADTNPAAPREGVRIPIGSQRPKPSNPVKPIPIWIGGSSEAALARAVRLADGWHGSRLAPEEAAPIVRRLREQRPEPEFAISLRYGWDGKDDAALAARLAAYAGAGVEHVLAEPAERELEDWLRAVERIARAAEEVRS